MTSTLVDPRDTTGLDVTALLSPEHRAHMAGLGRKYAAPSGLFMGPKPDDDDDADDDDDDDDDEDPIELELTDRIKVGNKTMTVRELQRIAATEKKQGKRSGQLATLKSLGFDTLEEAQAALAAAPKKKVKDKDDESDDEVARNAEREQERQEDRRKAKLKERKLDLRGALRDAGVSRDDLDAGEALLNRLVDEDYDDDDLATAVEELQESRAGRALFEDDTDDEDEGKAKKKSTAQLPTGRPKNRNKPPAQRQGAAGRSRAERKGWIKSDS